MNNITVFGRVDNVRNKNKLCFLIVRFHQNNNNNIETVQCISFKDDLCFEKVTKLSSETIVKIEGEKSNANIKSCTIKDYEVIIKNIEVLNQASKLPFELNNKENVLFDTQLNKRFFDLRSTINYEIFKTKSRISNIFQKYFFENNFIQIQTPKLISAASEGGSNVFELKYFDKKAYLAQSPQLYKQMMINADFNRVFEIGPVFRAENSNTNRHLCEFTGVDIEMELPNCNQFEYLVNFLWKMLFDVFSELQKSAVNKDIFDKFQPSIIPENPVILEFPEVVKLLRDHGCEQKDLDDLSSANEYKLGEIVKERFNSDLFFVTKYPSNIRPFYTMLDLDQNYSKSFDIIYKCQEISSGAQREHCYENLIKRIEDLNINKNGLEDYLESFTYGSKCHGGCGFGLDRITALYLGLNNVKKAVLFPRDPQRLTP